VQYSVLSLTLLLFSMYCIRWYELVMSWRWMVQVIAVLSLVSLSVGRYGIRWYEHVFLIGPRG